MKRCLVSVVLKASCSSPDSAPHFLPQINRINVLKSNLAGFRVKLPGWKNNRRRLVASQGIMRLALGLVEWLVFVLVSQIFVLILAGVLFNKCQLTAVIYRSGCLNTYSVGSKYNEIRKEMKETGELQHRIVTRM